MSTQCPPGMSDEVEEVLTVLRELAQRVSSPTIRVCLESAGDDIAHLTGTGAGEGAEGRVEAT